jgi:beta-aspartyl-peptidase (threonine type)
MNQSYLLLALFASFFLFSCSEPNQENENNQILGSSDIKPVIVIHGGAGFMNPNLPDSIVVLYESALGKSLDIGYSILEKGGLAIDAVKAAVNVLENDSLFNAGRGAVLTHEAQPSLDASIMDGNSLNAGAVAGVSTVKNPVDLALKVMHFSEHVLLSGKGAELFATQFTDLELVDPNYFITQRKLGALKRAINSEITQKERLSENDELLEKKFGTVGAVALDANGNIAAATSTGGMTNKKNGRIGDSPLIGSGNYADNKSAGVSCTGHGEYFIKVGVAKEICDRMQFGHQSLQEATENTLKKVEELGGSGGLISIDSQGNIALIFNTGSMLRGYVDKNGNKSVAIYGQSEFISM